MASRGSNKDRSRIHEAHVAKVYGGIVSPSSGAADTDQADVRTKSSLIECKTTGGPGLEHQPQLPSIAKLLQYLEKVAVEAWEEGREPVVAFRHYNPVSKCANRDGWVDISIRLLADDGKRDYWWAPE